MRNVLLLILDGWGESSLAKGNAIMAASTPNMDYFKNHYPYATLTASGEAVGLPPGQMGNSEVGHLNLGAGRIVDQELTRISKEIKTGNFFHNPVLVDAMKRVKERGAALHFMGLVSDGGVHSHLEHLNALLEMARREQLENYFVHAILDGRDTVPFGARPYLKKLTELSKVHQGGYVATVCGRYYAMDRDCRWERTKQAYFSYAKGEGLTAPGALEALEQAYARDESDEFVKPTVIVDKQKRPLATIKSEDSVIFFNFRPDRARQMTRAFTEEEFSEFNRGPSSPKPYFVTMTEYNRTFKLPVAFSVDDLKHTLGEVYACHNLPQARIAETEKYAHVTFFFSGGRENPFPGEKRLLVPSPKVATYDLKPEMSAASVKDEIIKVLSAVRHPLIVANFANADMVGHTGNFKATVQAIETVDRALGEIVKIALRQNWVVLICADHGNAEEMLGSHEEALTAHSTNPVPFILLGAGQVAVRPEGILADIAPTVLDLAGLDVPKEMTGLSMLKL